MNTQFCGKSNILVGAKISFYESVNEERIKLTGTATHAFQCFNPDKMMIGVYLDQKGIYNDDICNVYPFEVTVLR